MCTGVNNLRFAGNIAHVYAVDGRIQMSYERVFGPQAYVRDGYIHSTMLLVAC